MPESFYEALKRQLAQDKDPPKVLDHYPTPEEWAEASQTLDYWTQRLREARLREAAETN